MSAQPRQLDVFLHTPAKLAKAWRAAAEKSREQFPMDESRARWYEREAERYELQAKENMTRKRKQTVMLATTASATAPTPSRSRNNHARS